MKHDAGEKKAYKSSKPNSIKLLDLHWTFLLEVIPRSYVSTLLHSFGIMSQYRNLRTAEYIVSLPREYLTHNWYSIVTRDDAVRVRVSVMVIMSLTIVDPSDTDIDTGNHPYKFMFFYVW